MGWDRVCYWVMRLFLTEFSILYFLSSSSPFAFAFFLYIYSMFTFPFLPSFFNLLFILRFSVSAFKPSSLTSEWVKWERKVFIVYWNTSTNSIFKLLKNLNELSIRGCLKWVQDTLICTCRSNVFRRREWEIILHTFRYALPVVCYRSHKVGIFK